MVNPPLLCTALPTPIASAPPCPLSRRLKDTPSPFTQLKPVPQTAIESIAFAGVDMPVHLVVTLQGVQRESARRQLLVLDYPEFSRILREQAPRSATIKVLSALGAQPTVDATSGCRNWVQIHVQDIIGSSLALSSVSSLRSQHIPSIAA